MIEMNKEMRIKNYTTSIPWAKTVYEIEQMLTSMGADAILKNYRGDGRVEALSFQYNRHGYKLPANSEKCSAKLREIGEYKSRPRQWLDDQAERVAWRVIKDWLEAQFALIQIGQAEVEQVMLPYMWNGRQSLYEVLKKDDFKALEGRRDNKEDSE